VPWDERTRVDQRREFIEALESCAYTMTELCEVFGISRKTGYKWLHRYAEEGEGGLEDRSRAPRSCPHRTDRRCEQALVEERRRHPRWGARKLLVVLQERHPGWPWPAASTAGQILKRHGLVVLRRRRRRKAQPGKPVLEVTQPNEVWTADFKGEFRLGNRQMCYPLTVADLKSRYLLGCDGKTSTATDPARATFERLFDRYGMPDKILTDSGTPFASPRSLRRLSRLSVWWVRLGIEPLLIQPGHPEQNGCHERMHRTLKAATAHPPAGDMRNQQGLFDEFRGEYNTLRPHEALGMKRPASLYKRSTRRFPGQAPELPYPGHFELRRVRPSGEIKWRGEFLFLGETLHGNTVGLEETAHQRWSIYLGPILLARYDERDGYLARL
jgi:putative transposase